MMLVVMFDIKHGFILLSVKASLSKSTVASTLLLSSSLSLSLSYRLLASRYLAYSELLDIQLSQFRLILPGIYI